MFFAKTIFLKFCLTTVYLWSHLHLFIYITYLFLKGRVLVHCLVGVSRSATCVLAYLMIYRRMSAIDAIRTVAMRRGINPNDGFLQQLAELDIALRRQTYKYY